MAISALKQNKTTIQIGTLVDWSYDDQVMKLQKQLRKILKKSLKTDSVRNNRINTFTVTSANLQEVPILSQRLKAEELIKKILRDYSDRVNACNQKAIRYNGDTKVYLKAFKGLKLKFKDEIVRVQHEYLDKVERKISEIVTSSFVTVWTLASDEPDKLIIGNFAAQVNTKIDQNLDEMIDELLITNLGKQFLPYTSYILNNLYDSLLKLGDLTKITISENKHLNNIINQFVGSISGLQEGLKLLVRQIKHVHKMIRDNVSELQKYESQELSQWITTFESLEVEHSLSRISQINDLITNYKINLRSMKKVQGSSNGRLLNLDDIMTKIIVTRAKVSGLRHWIGRFESLPNFTSLKKGIAYEEVDDEDYQAVDESNLLEATKIFKNFTRGGSTIYALRGIDLVIKQGEFVVIKGPSGSGKTTLLNILAGLESVNRGAVFFKGDDLTEMKDRKKSNLRRKNFSFIFQNYALIPHLTAHENVKVPLDLNGLSKELKKDIQLLLDNVGIGSFAEHKPALLSGGQMQRLAIARALISKPKVIFADEPTGDLDRETSLVIMDLIKRYQFETGTTIILVTHDDEIAKYGSRLVHVKDGQLQNEIN